MEESISLLRKLQKEFACDAVDLRSYSPLTLAFLGDCVYDLIIRTVIVERGNRAAQGLHKMKSSLVNAKTQAQLVQLILSDLTEEELTVYKRGRNAKSFSTAKNASVTDYRKATGLETLLGYLYLLDEEDRIIELIKTGLRKMEREL